MLALGAPYHCGHPPSVRADDNRLTPPGGALDLLADAARGHVPEPPPLIAVRPAYQPGAVEAEGQCPHDAGVRQSRTRLASQRVPQAHRLIPAPRGDPAAVRAEGHRVDV